LSEVITKIIPRLDVAFIFITSLTTYLHLRDMSSRIDELADSVVSGTRAVSEYLNAHQLPLPSFEENGPVDLQIQSAEVQQARSNAINACFELLDLLQGPQALVRPLVSL